VSARVTRAVHRADVDPEGRPGPFILTTCVGDDGTVWSVLTDAAGAVIGRTVSIPSPPGDAFRTTYRALDRDGQLWCETSDPREVLASTEGDGPGPFILQKINTFVTSYGWQAWDGTVR
jgi:hypothetical protein